VRSINDILSRSDLQRIKDRFEKRFVPAAPDQCWEWTAGKTPKGYGRATGGNRELPAHRLAWVLYVGPIPQGEGYHGTCVLHRCDNPGCVNPNHLFLGTAHDNMLDMAAKDRSLHGSRYKLHKLTEEHARSIRADQRPRIIIAREHGIARNTVARIQRGLAWVRA